MFRKLEYLRLKIGKSPTVGLEPTTTKVEGLVPYCCPGVGDPALNNV